MFDWITKPYIEWSVVDTMFCYGEVFLLIILIILLAGIILNTKDKIQEKLKEGK